MSKKKVLNIQGAVLDKYQIGLYLEKIATDHVLKDKSDTETYPIPRLNENYAVIKEVYKLLNEQIKRGIPIHPAGEWILDNLYVIEEIVKNVTKDLSLKKYKNFLGLANKKYDGFARIYVLAAEMVAYTDCNINNKNLEEMIKSYQNKKDLTMDEVWNIGEFLQIAIIENIRVICEKIYLSQIQKSKVEQILKKTIGKNDEISIGKNKKNNKKKAISVRASKQDFKLNLQDNRSRKNELSIRNQIKYTFVEYMSYKLKKYGKQAYSYLKILEEEVNKAGSSTEEIIKKEHFDVALRKVSMGNSITSLKTISRINFLEIFEKINGVEDILKNDPANQYTFMDSNTKILYRNIIKEISKKTKLSEIYIAKKCLELSKSNLKHEKKSHVGYYLVDEGKVVLLSSLINKKVRCTSNETKTKIYISVIWTLTVIMATGLSVWLFRKLNSENCILSVLMFIFLLLPIENIVTKIVQYILSKATKPKLIPKLDFQNGVPAEYSTFIVIPTILKNTDQVKKLMNKLEVFYLANKSENLYFALLGDCSSSKEEIEDFDSEVMQTGISEAKRLNAKYTDIKFDKFSFIYRKRIWNECENCYLGWERKRGLLNQFNEYILGKTEDPFRINTIEDEKKDKIDIKYVITLDADTDLTLNSGLELIGAMAHVLNRPVLNEKKDLVISGHGIIAPRVGVSLLDTRKSLFTMIYAGEGGTDSYTNAISDLYQDNFDEGIYAGKGIYDLQVFETVLNNEVKANTVLSHDLLEGCYLRSGYASDIMLMDGYPTNYLSFRKRLYRWTRGDYQILLWLKNEIENKNGEIKRNPLTLLSKYKIASNIFRSKLDVEVGFLIAYSIILYFVFKSNLWQFIAIGLISIAMPVILDCINIIVSKRENIIRTKTFTKTIDGAKASFIRTIINIGLIPDKAYIALKAEYVTLFRMVKTKKNLLEWETSEETEKNIKKDCVSYYKSMVANTVVGLVCLIGSFLLMTNEINKQNPLTLFLILLFAFTLAIPYVMWQLGKKIKVSKEIEKISGKDKTFLVDVSYRTWQFFRDNLIEENNYLPPDNYQEDRKPIVIKRTSSTNIGLALLAVVSSYDMEFENLKDTIDLLEKMINTISKLAKWNGHLYNWYNIETLEPLIPRYISSVDSGNFIGYLYTLLQFLKESKEKIYVMKISEGKLYKIDRSITKEKNIGNENTISKIESIIFMIETIIKDTDFSKLYDGKNRLFSVGYNVEENKLTDSYYDLLASEARQTSFVAIAKKDISPKHWANLSRTLTRVNNYKGLVSWSGTAFEYLMPNINIPKYPGSILDESCKFLIMSQKLYSNRLGVPWGFSEAAFNLRDLNNNYQYKAFGIPWLGLKRGLADEIVISSYGSILAINENLLDVFKNLKMLQKNGMYSKYGFYESIDYTPTRVKDRFEIIKSYMAHHQGLILLAINNLFNNNIFQERFMRNPEMQSVAILLEEKMPNNMIITKEEKEKVEKIKYVDYEDYSCRTYNKIDENLNISNVISNDKYTIVMDQYGNGYSKYKETQINRFKPTSDVQEGITFFIKDIKNKRIWTNTYSKYLSKPDKYKISFYPDMSKIFRVDGSIETVTKVITATDDPVEIRRLELKNTSMLEQTFEVTSFIEPILSDRMQDYAHKAFNNLFITFEYIDTINTILVKRNVRTKDESKTYMAVKLYVEDDENTDTEYEINKINFFGRSNLNIPKAVEDSLPLSRKIERVTDPIIALKKIVNIKPEESRNVNLILSVSESKDEALKNVIKFTNNQTIDRTFELSRARVEAETRYLRIKGSDIEVYQKMLSYLLFESKVSVKRLPSSTNDIYAVSGLWKFGISGDLPILLVKVREMNDIDTVKEVINAYEYYRSKNIKIDLVILNEEIEGYESYVKDGVISSILNKNLGYLINIKGGIYCLNNINSKQDKQLLEQKANVTIVADNGSLEEQIKELEMSIKELVKNSGYDIKKEYIIDEKDNYYKDQEFNENNLKYFNEYGGFSEDGKEYRIRVNKNNKLPTVWSHIITNEHFGTLVTENSGGYTWKDNSKLNRLTAWDNNQVTDVPSEVIYFKDINTDKKWSLGLNPMPDENDYYITYGFGYAKYMHVSDEMEQELNIFIPEKDNIKVNLIHLENRKPESRNIKIIYYLKPVLDEDEIKSNGEINIEFNQSLNMLILKNVSNDIIKDKMFISCSEKIESYTGNKTSFFKNTGLGNPDGLDQIELNRENSYGKDGIVAIMLNVRIDAMSGKDIVLSFGVGQDNSNCQDIAYKYSNVNNCKEEFTKTKKYWSDLVGKVQVKTPIESINILLNGWLIYQTLTSRLWGRTGYYQSGGAYGFRDQLQDMISVKYFLPEIAKRQILKHSNHQFIEGDVEHWWHEESSRGIRTKFSDDLLWLPYVTSDYIDYTNDYEILEEETFYRDGELLKDGVNEIYDLYKESNKKENLYKHCIRAIDYSLKFGKNGLPLIGSGDWNDGMSNVGVLGKGESVWLGFFMYDVLKKFIPICKYKKDEENALKYLDIMEKLKKALNTNGWDGRWYKRAFTDEGNTLGSLQNEECRIDSISQSWSVISGAGDNDKKYISMESLENHLIDRANGIIKLLDPPFEKSKLEPGYIKSYIPGTRENGGQYTHGAVWTVIANALLNLNDKAFEYYKMINPIEHSRTRETANKYKVEPYVIAADVYGAGNLAGRGGWTWYTGASSWMYVAGIKYILGINIENEILRIQPHIPEGWKEYSVRLKYGKSMYNIKINKVEEKNNEKNNILINDQIIKDGNIQLNKNGGVYNIQIDI